MTEQTLEELRIMRAVLSQGGDTRPNATRGERLRRSFTKSGHPDRIRELTGSTLPSKLELANSYQQELARLVWRWLDHAPASKIREFIDERGNHKLVKEAIVGEPASCLEIRNCLTSLAR